MAYNVLIVDDSKTVRAVIAKTLRLSKIPIGELFEAVNGQEALDVTAGRWIDLILADINMPVMNGVEMIERLRADENTVGIPVVVVSTEGSQTRIDALKELGVCGYLRKPFQPEEFREIVTNVLGESHE